MKSIVQYFLMTLLGLVSVEIYTHNIPTFGGSEIQTSTFRIATSGTFRFNNRANYNFTPIDIATSSPVIKIVASDVMIDFNDIGINNIDTTHAGWIGIEIGWSLQELIDDPTRVQPHNISLQNLSLHNFDCGIIIHAGIQTVYLENIKFQDCPVGLVMLGTSNNDVQDIDLKGIGYIGQKVNHHTALVNLKTRIETTYAYGADYFMPLAADPFNSNTVDVYSYYGIWAKYLKRSTLEDINVEPIGYNYVTLGSAGNGFRTQTFGIVLRNAHRILMKSINSAESFSEIKATGLLLDNSSSLTIANSTFSYHTSSTRAVGIEITNDTSADYSVKGLELFGVYARNNVSDDVAIGLDLSSLHGLKASKLECKFNRGDKQAYGIYMDTSETIDLQDSDLGENSATRVSNDVATTHGIVAAGLYGDNIELMLLKNVNFNSMQALNSAYGLYLDHSGSCRFEGCLFTGNTATSMRSGEATDIRTQQDAQEISKHAPVVEATSTGGYGVFMQNTSSIRIENCSASTNRGHRAIGLNFKNCRAISIFDTFTASQSATGAMLDSSFKTDNVANPTAIAIQAAHKSLLFGDTTKTTVDAIATTDLFLEKMSSIRSAQLAGSAPAYNDVIAMLATSSLLQATIARYRLWGVAMGVHAYNVVGCLLVNCTCVGNSSVLDNGIGVCFTGRSVDHTVRSSNLAFNIGTAASIITPSGTGAFTYKYNLIGMKNFWETLLGYSGATGSYAATTGVIGIYNTGANFILQGQKTFGNEATGNNVYITFTSATGNDRAVISPVGPMGAGLIMGDVLLEGVAQDCSMYGNLGNAGHTHGALMDHAFSVTLDNNLIAGNIANVYGVSFGLVDRTAHSPNLFTNNYFEGNKCSTFNNSNYCVPFNSADTNTLAFPIKQIMNGKFASTVTEFDNVEVLYSTNSQFYAIEYLYDIPQHPDIVAYLTANSCWA